MKYHLKGNKMREESCDIWGENKMKTVKTCNKWICTSKFRQTNAVSVKCGQLELQRIVITCLWSLEGAPHWRNCQPVCQCAGSNTSRAPMQRGGRAKASWPLTTARHFSSKGQLCLCVCSHVNFMLIDSWRQSSCKIYKLEFDPSDLQKNVPASTLLTN